MNSAIANTTESLILRKAAEVGQKSIVDSMGYDASTVSRMVSSKTGVHINELELFLKPLNLKIIECDGETVTMPRDRYEALRTLARAGV